MAKKIKVGNRIVKQQEQDLIRSLLNFKHLKNNAHINITNNAHNLEYYEGNIGSNLKLEFYTNKYNYKYPLFIILKYLKRQDGWINSDFLGEESIGYKGAVTCKIKDLVKEGIVEKRLIKWRRYNSKKIKPKNTYRLAHTVKALDFISNLLNNDESNLKAKKKEFKQHVKGKSPKDYIKRLPIENTDYFSIIPKEVKRDWFFVSMQELGIKKRLIESKIKRLKDLIKIYGGDNYFERIGSRTKKLNNGGKKA